MSSKKEIGINYKVEGRFRIESDKRGVIADWQKNIITNLGVKSFFKRGERGSFTSWCKICLGTGTATPSRSDTSLGNELTSFSVRSRAYKDKDDYMRLVLKGSSGKGAAEGNISEVGLKSHRGDLLTRARIKDAGGSPTTISIADDEIIKVIYEIKLHIPKNYSKSGTVDWGEGDVNYTITTGEFRERNLEYSFFHLLGGVTGQSGGAGLFHYTYLIDDTATYSGAGSDPSGGNSAFFEAYQQTVSAVTYSNGVAYADATIVMGPNDANLSNVKYFKSVPNNSGWHYIIKFDTTFDKDNTKKLTMKIRVTVDAT